MLQAVTKYPTMEVPEVEIKKAERCKEYTRRMEYA
jgi:hypothetical protein